jgi:hypothetical protein
MSGSNIRLRGTHKKLLRSIGLAKLNYFLVARASTQRIRVINDLRGRLEKYGEPLSARNINFLNRKIIEANLATESDLRHKLSKRAYRRLLDAREQQHNQAPIFALDQMIASLAFAFEEYMIRALFKYYQDNIERLNRNSEIKFASIIDILKRENIDRELVKALVYKETGRGGATKIIDALNAAGMSVAASADLEELFLVRNAIAHNGSLINEQLVSFDKRFVGVFRLHLSFNDYLRYKKVVISRAQMIREEFNKVSRERMSNLAHVRYVIRQERDNKIANSRIKRSKTQLVVIGTPMPILSKLVKDVGFVSLKHLRSLVESDIFEYRYFVWKYAAFHIGKGREDVLCFALNNTGYLENIIFVRLLASSLRKYGLTRETNSMLFEDWGSSNQPVKKMLLDQLNVRGY